MYRVDGLLIFEVNAEAPDAASAASFLDRRSTFMNGCYPVRYPSGGVTRIEPASSRKNQTMYTVRHDDFDEQTTIFTIKDAWVIEVTVFASSSAPVIGDIMDTLLDQARA